MEEMIRYIFENIHRSEKRLRVVGRFIGSQRAFNRNIMLLTTLTTVYLVIKEFEIRNMHRQIEGLKSKIKELEQEEGD